MPDILLLPQLAAFFDVTIDELLGYEPQLSKEQMKKIYLDLASDFAKNPFEKLIEQVQKLEKEYYSCYPFLYQLTLLYLNHFMLAGDQKRQQDILEHCLGLCDRILASGWSTEYLAIHRAELEVCEETIRRVEMVAKAYDLVHLKRHILR